MDLNATVLSPPWLQFTEVYWMAVGKQQRTQEEYTFAWRVMDEMKQMHRRTMGQTFVAPGLEIGAERPPHQGINSFVAAPPANFGVAPQRPPVENEKPIIPLPIPAAHDPRPNEVPPSGVNQEPGPYDNNTPRVIVKREPLSERREAQNGVTAAVQLPPPPVHPARVKRELTDADEAAPIAQAALSERRLSLRPRSDASGPSNDLQVGVKPEVASQERPASVHHSSRPRPPPASPDASPDRLDNGAVNERENEENMSPPPPPPPVDYTPAVPRVGPPRFPIKPEVVPANAHGAEDGNDERHHDIPIRVAVNKKKNDPVVKAKTKRARRESSPEPVHRFNLRRGTRTVVHPDPIKIGFVNERDNDFPMPTLKAPYVLIQTHGSTVPAAATALLILTDDASKQRQFSRDVPMAIVVMKDGGTATMKCKGKRMDSLMSGAIRDWMKNM